MAYQLGEPFCYLQDYIEHAWSIEYPVSPWPRDPEHGPSSCGKVCSRRCDVRDNLRCDESRPHTHLSCDRASIDLFVGRVPACGQRSGRVVPGGVVADSNGMTAARCPGCGGLMRVVSSLVLIG